MIDKKDEEGERQGLNSGAVDVKEQGILDRLTKNCEDHLAVSRRSRIINQEVLTTRVTI